MGQIKFVYKLFMELFLKVTKTHFINHMHVHFSSSALVCYEHLTGFMIGRRNKSSVYAVNNANYSNS